MYLGGNRKFDRFGHLQNLYSSSSVANDTNMGMDVTTVASLEKNNVAEPTKAFWLWMLVVWKYQRNPRTRQNLDKETTKNDVVIPNRIKTTEERAAVVDLSESMMELNSEVINPRKHSAIVFKEIEASNIVKPNGQVDSTERGKGIFRKG
ncbi:hypothetical protein GOBAR_AA09853 [Gossypium barbadense]|uniref:Uncharacterized protein n=1 Tax=Gossypium barbadense TaxID=3634 RepID=A0A2P5Y5G4_GOSBA|nr:hypothetical protein GOBAR_AA09853 [Gossypium barbadense]